MSKPITRSKPGRPAGFHHPDHAARRSRQDRVPAFEQRGRRQPAGRGHEHEADALIRGLDRLPQRLPLPRAGEGRGRGRLPRLCAWGELLRHLRHVTAQDRRQVGVHHGGVATRDELDEGRDFVAGRDLRKAELARERGHALLVRRIPIGMHEHDRDRLDPLGQRLLQLRPQPPRDPAPAPRCRRRARARRPRSTRSYSIDGLMMWRAKIFGRAW